MCSENLRFPKAEAKQRTIILLALAVCIGLVGFRQYWLSANQASWLLVHGYYWVLLGLSITAGWLVCRFIPPYREKIWANRWFFVIYAALITLICLHEPMGFKVLYDEHGFANTSYNIHSSLQVAQTGTTAWSDGRTIPTSGKLVDFRPSLYPFGVAALHNLTGFRINNLFYFNIAASIILLCTLHLLLARYLVPVLASTLTLIFGFLPLLAQSVNRGGYEILNLLLIVCFIHSSICYLKKDSATETAPLLCACLLSNLRTESVLFLLPLGCFILLKWRQVRALRLHWPTPLLLATLAMPFALHVYYNHSPITAVQRSDTSTSWSAFIDHIQTAGTYLFNTNGAYSNSIPCTLMILTGTIIAPIHLARRWLQSRTLQPTEWVALATITTILTYTTYMVSFRWGSWLDPMVTRFTLPLHLAGIFGTACLISLIPANRIHHRQRTTWAIALGVGLFYNLPAIVQHKYTTSMTTSMESAWLREQLSTCPPEDTFIISKESPILGTLGYATTTTARAKYRLWEIERGLKDGRYQKYYLFQHWGYNLDLQSYEPIDEEAVDQLFELNPVAQARFAPWQFAQLSEIKAVRPHKQSPPPDYDARENPPARNFARNYHLTSP